jgi:hypothetical protein
MSISESSVGPGKSCHRGMRVGVWVGIRPCVELGLEVCSDIGLGELVLEGVWIESGLDLTISGLEGVVVFVATSQAVSNMNRRQWTIIRVGSFIRFLSSSSWQFTRCALDEAHAFLSSY